ncbi:NAD-dependent epimerase/dehydratase family protein [Nocardiopsis halophila]|uniref:NAD-dependent epimerase/dehydratase family protein n=1 Tax=Nocardiopsis halophila TaxID=141692 RepID=UPI00036B5D96|nr:NAD(P)-dependent oxidoreductase [Nocardiopsis halophila]
MRVLVTGGSGRLGRSVVEVFARRGHDVTSVDASPGPERPGVASRRVDLLDDAARAQVFAEVRPEAVAHLAGIAVPHARPGAETVAVNARLAWGVLEDARAHGARSVAAASSPTVFGYGSAEWAPERLPLDEEHPVAPVHAYGLSKLVIEEAVRTLARSGQGCVFTAVRPGYVIAPEEWEGAPTQQGHTVAERLDRPELAAASLFNYVDARDAAELFALVAEDASGVAHGRVLHAVAGDPMARGPLSELLPRFHPGTAKAAAALAPGQGAFSSREARRLLGWTPRRTWRSELRS